MGQEAATRVAREAHRKGGEKGKGAEELEEERDYFEPFDS